MIAEVAILVWIMVSLMMFATLPPLRAFLLTYFIGMMFLPVEVMVGGTGYLGSIAISQSLRIDKLAACNIGAFLGTLMFAGHLFRRYRFHWVDAAYFLIVVGMFITSCVNDQGAKDGLSNGVDNLRMWLPVIILSRVHIVSASDVHQAMRALVGGAFVYAFICVGEFRLAPQSHNLIYGYFQHSFDQFMRYSHFRPVGFMHHAIELSFFMGTSAALALWLWYKKLLKPLWGMVPGGVVVITLLVGLASTLTFSGYAAFLICVAVLAASTVLRTRWLLLLLPVLAIVWMGGRYTNVIDADLLLRTAGWFDPDRAESLKYRLTAERENLNAATENVAFGKSAAGVQSRMAVDAWWLIEVVFFGVVGLTGWYLVWSAGLITAFLRWRWLTPDLRTLSIVMSVMIGAQFFDFLFNAFPSVYLMILNVGIVSAIQHYKPVRHVRQAYTQPPGVQVPGGVMPVGGMQ